MLCLHGHGNGKDDVVGVTHGDENRERHIRALNYDYAHQFAERGYLALTFDYRCFGERSEAYPGRDQCNVHFIRGSIHGINLLTLHIHDTKRALDYLISRPEVDEQRIGCVGLSFGGTMTMWISALDKRIRAACISCYLSEFRTFAVEKGNFCGSQFVPGLYKYFDIADIAALIAPAPLLIESGKQDPGFPFESSSRAFHRLEKVYEVLGERDRLEWDAFDGQHEFSGRKAFAFFDKWLK